jgi:hypothetical protein
MDGDPRQDPAYRATLLTTMLAPHRNVRGLRLYTQKIFISLTKTYQSFICILGKILGHLGQPKGHEI